MQKDIDEITAFKTSPDLIKKMKEIGIRKTFSPNKVLIVEDGCIRSIPIVTKGLIKVMRTEEDGREILLYYLQSGESCIVSIMGGMYNKRSQIKAVVEKEAEILFIPVQKIQVFVRKYPEWLDYMLKLYFKRFEELLEIVNAIAFKKVDERLLNLLHKHQEVKNTEILHLTHQELADDLGTARVVVSRLLKVLEVEGKVKLGRGKVTLL